MYQPLKVYLRVRPFSKAELENNENQVSCEIWHHFLKIFCGELHSKTVWEIEIFYLFFVCNMLFGGPYLPFSKLHHYNEITLP